MPVLGWAVRRPEPLLRQTRCKQVVKRLKLIEWKIFVLNVKNNKELGLK